jgi:periplasmic divalent cation tolerance protein
VVEVLIMSDDSSSVVIVYCTVPEDCSRLMAKSAVDLRLCACVSIMPVLSVYLWEGSLCEDDELLLLMKTTADRLDSLVTWILSVHPYEVPEILAVPANGSAPYSDWVRLSVGD